MRIKSLITVILLLKLSVVSSQDALKKYETIPDGLTKNANAVVRLYEINVNVKSIRNVEITRKRIVTVLNSKGLGDIGAFAGYDNHTKVKSIEAIIYSEHGEQLKKIRKKDFVDVSAVSGGTMYSDSRVKYLDFTPVSYPFTVEFTCKTQTNNTVNLPRYSPLGYYLGIEKSRFSIVYPSELKLYKKELNLEEYTVGKSDKPGYVVYSVSNLKAIKPEKSSPSADELIPRVFFALNKFSYDGIEGEVNNWQEFGSWMYNNLLEGRTTVDAQTKAKILDLVKDAKTDREKAKIVYEFVQNKTRYISVQVGIGGFQPIPAKEVDKVGYGDCKGLTNYTMALLQIVGVESYYTHVEAGSEIIGFYDDFASLAQGNHVILNIPNNGDDIWLECTSQKVPFGHIGDFTDDRNVLVITPEGGKIKHTKKYLTDENTQSTAGKYTLTNEGNLSAEVVITTKGIQYDDRYYMEDWSEKNKKEYYKKYWRNINNVTINNISHTNDKDAISFAEEVNFKADAYGVITGDRMLFAPNALNKYSHVPDRYRKRKFPLQISRGFFDSDAYDIQLPTNYKVEALPNNVTHESKFGSYTVTITQKDDHTLHYERVLKIKDGQYPKEDYKVYRRFLKDIVKFDNAKIVLIKK